jgi:dienelactone hydrolase
MNLVVLCLLLFFTGRLGAESLDACFAPPAGLRNDFGKHKRLEAGQEAIRASWEKEIGRWPAPIERPELEILSSTNREVFTQERVRVQVSARQHLEGWLLRPSGKGPFPAVVVPFYEPDTSIGLKGRLRDFGYQLAKRGFVTLSIGSPGGDARKPETAGVEIQPLHYLGYVAANCANALASVPKVDAKRIGIVGHSYGGKWAMFAMAFSDKFACGAWSDPGIVFDESRPNVNYWEPWYLGKDPKATRRPGAITAENPRTGAYKRLVEGGRDLTEVMALIAPRPFLVSGGSEDPPERWQALNRVNEVYAAMGATGRIAMSSRPGHEPTEESNALIYAFFERFLAGGPGVP